jgi:hypothetical protein
MAAKTVKTKTFLRNVTCKFVMVFANCIQRTRLAAVWGLEIRLPVTAAWLCFVVEVKNFCLALFVEPITEAK